MSEVMNTPTKGTDTSAPPTQDMFFGIKKTPALSFRIGVLSGIFLSIFGAAVPLMAPTLVRFSFLLGFGAGTGCVFMIVGGAICWALAEDLLPLGIFLFCVGLIGAGVCSEVSHRKDGNPNKKQEAPQIEDNPFLQAQAPSPHVQAREVAPSDPNDSLNIDDI